MSKNFGVRVIHRCALSTGEYETPWIRVLLEKLTGLQLVKKTPAFYGTRKLITAFTSARHRSLSWASTVQTPTSHFIKIHFSIILLSTPGSLQWSLSFRFPHQNHVHASPLPNRSTSYSSRFCHPQYVVHNSQLGRNRHLPLVLCCSVTFTANCSCYCLLFLYCATLTEVFPCFFLSCKANARV
jgi:hypothetical protein